MKLLGTTEDVTTCDCCGRVDLKCTVAFETEDGMIAHYGRTCATYHYGRKAKEIRAEIKTIQSQVEREAQQEFNLHPARAAYTAKLEELNWGPRLEFYARMEILGPFIAACDAAKAEIKAKYLGRYFVEDFYLH